MKTFYYILLGIFAGLLTAFSLTLIAIWLIPLFNGGSGSDAMSQGLMGTLIMVFTSPVLGILGGFMGYQKAKR